MKRKISLAFALLVAVFVMKVTGGISWVFNPFRSGMYMKNISGYIRYASNLVLFLAPAGLAVLLHFHQKKSMAKTAGIVCLFAGGASLFFAVKSAINLLMILRGGPDIYALVMHTPLLGMLMDLFIGIGYLKVGLELFTGTKSKGIKGLLIFGAVLIIFVGILRTVGHASITELIRPLLLMLALALVIPAYTDRSKCAMVSVKSIIALAVVIGLLMVIPDMLSGTSSSGNTGTSSSAKKCRSCGRTFTDSTNKSSISRTNMCKNCYNNFQWASSAVGK